MPVVLVAGATGPVHRGSAMVFGMGAAFLGGLAWGVIAATLGYDFAWAELPLAVLIGLFVGWAVHAGARRGTADLMGFAGLLAFLAVVLGDILAWSVLATPYGYAPTDLISYYRHVLATPKEAAVRFVSAAFGVAAALLTMGKDLWEERRRWPKAPSGLPPAVPPPEPPEGLDFRQI